MVSFRFHLVSLVAVFLALGLGVLAGTTVISRTLVRNLEKQTANFGQRADRLDRQVDSLRAFRDQLTGHVIDGRLSGTEVVLVTQEGTDEGAIAASRRALEGAGADMLGLLTVGGRMALPDQASRTELASIVGRSATEDPDALAAEAAREMASELAFGPVGDTLPELIRDEFVLIGGRELGDSVLRSLDGDEAVVMVAGGRDRPPVDPSRFLVPLAEGLVEDGARVAAAEPLRTGYPFVTLLREDGAVADRIATQDNVDQVAGEVGLVLAVEDVMTGTPGHYGVKDGVDDLIPPP
jgi:Copper transport outer membrane protein, MctB